MEPTSLLSLGERQGRLRRSWDDQVRFQKIMCILRDGSPEEAMEPYLTAFPYRYMIAGIGLDRNEYNRPLLFHDLFVRTRADGFKITAHCDATVVSLTAIYTCEGLNGSYAVSVSLTKEAGGSGGWIRQIASVARDITAAQKDCP